MASIKQLNERKFKITISNGYRPDGRKISKAKTITVPNSVSRRGIRQYVVHAAEEMERTIKQGFCEDGEMTFEEYSLRWLDRQVKYAAGTIASYRRMLKVTYPFIGAIKLNKLRPIALENMLVELRKRSNHGNSYLIVVSMGYDFDGKRRKPQQKTVHPPEDLTPKAKEKWIEEEAALFERQCKNEPLKVDKSITLAAYTELWLREIAPTKLAKSTLARDKQDIDRFMPYLGGFKLTDLKPEHFRNLYSELRKQKNSVTGKPLSECTVEGVHACLCGILSDAMEGGFLSHNPAWRTYKYAGKKKKKQNVADEETTQKLIAALEKESIKYETYFKLIIATGMRRGECCGLKWCDVNFNEKSIHICRNVVKVTGEDIIVKEPKTTAGDRYVYFSAEMASLLKEYHTFCKQETETYDERELTPDDYIFRRHGMKLPMTPSSFTWRFKLILKKHGLPENLNIHSLRHTAASLMIAGGADVATVSGLLGHSQVSTTLDIYTHAFDDKKKAASAVLQESLDI